MPRPQTPYTPDLTTLRLLDDLREALAEGREIQKAQKLNAARKARLVKRLRSKGLTNKRIADEAGVSLTIVQRLLYGRK
jgi:DNA-binding NarL/FixJ family response regulator